VFQAPSFGAGLRWSFWSFSLKNDERKRKGTPPRGAFANPPSPSMGLLGEPRRSSGPVSSVGLDLGAGNARASVRASMRPFLAPLGSLYNALHSQKRVPSSL
jgi:hypothetical protein